MARSMSRRLRVAAVGVVIALAALVLTTAATPSSVSAAPTVSYTTQLESLGPVVAALYQPATPTPNENIAVVAFHESANLIGSAPCLQLAERGFTVLCSHNPYTELSEVIWDQVALDIGDMVSFARTIPAVQHVVLLGWSGGGADVSYYQNVAQNGVKACQAAARLDPCSSSLAGLPPADGVMLLDSIPGLAFQLMSDLDPSVSQPQGLTKSYNPSLYLFNPKNGFTNLDSESDYSTAFLNRYTAAQASREAELVKAAQATQKKIADGDYYTTDDGPFPVGHVAARPWQQDDSLLAHTKGEYPLITPSSPAGTKQVVSSVRVPVAEQDPVPSSPAADESWDSAQCIGGCNFTVSTFMSTFAINGSGYRLTSDGIEGVDWASSNTSVITNLAGVTTPLLVMSETGHYWVVPSEMYYQAATHSKDKTLAYVWGGSHSFTPCTQCSSDPSQYGDTEAETFTYITNWLESRY